MTPTENLYYALGEMAYAVARADGRIQNDEVKKFHAILEAELQVAGDSLNIADIIFHIMDKDHVDAETAYTNAIRQMKLNSQYLSAEMKLSFLHVVEKVAIAFPPALRSEKNMIARFRKDISEIWGDPVFCDVK
jgi:uncharacterized tellurite resistance protein B-like protein